MSKKTFKVKIFEGRKIKDKLTSPVKGEVKIRIVDKNGNIIDNQKTNTVVIVGRNTMFQRLTDIQFTVKDETENEVLRSNWEHLANGRVRRFSNAGLGEQWYALMLETPKPVKVRQRRGRIR